MMSIGTESSSVIFSGVAPENHSKVVGAEEHRVSDRRYGNASPHPVQEPCSTSVTSAHDESRQLINGPSPALTVP
jgi:hypothetical protein